MSYVLLFSNLVLQKLFSLSRSLSAATMGVKEQVDSVIKSEEDLRKYRALVLENNLKVLLISDPNTDKSAAALDVHIGK